MNSKQIAALQRLSARLNRLAAECIFLREEMAEFGFDYPIGHIDPANFPHEVWRLQAQIDEKVNLELTNLPAEELPF